MKWIFIVPLLFLTGCSSFHREWKAANASPRLVGAIDGPWQGEWRSDRNGHHGSLRCVVSRTSPTTWRAHYRARYMKILRATYVANLTGTETNGVVSLEGSTDLGRLAGGVYTYKGAASATNFFSTYSCKWDHGKYEMKRPEAGASR